MKDFFIRYVKPAIGYGIGFGLGYTIGIVCGVIGTFQVLLVVL